MISKFDTQRCLEKLLTLSSFALIGISMSACSAIEGAFSKGTAQEATNSSSAAAVAAFQSGFYSFAVKNCASCHGSNQSPLFAVNNVDAAYNAALPYLILSAPTTSAFVGHASDSHCSSSACEVPANSPIVAGYMTAWANVIASSGGGSPLGGGSGGCPAGLDATTATYVLSPMPIPSGLPAATGTTGKVVRWVISGSNLTPAVPALDGAVFEVQIQQLTATTYKVIAPRMIVSAANGATAIAGVHVMVQAAGSGYGACEQTDAENWESPLPTEISTTINPSTIPNPLPATLTSTVLSTEGVEIPVLSGSDNISIGFDTL